MGKNAAENNTFEHVVRDLNGSPFNPKSLGSIVGNHSFGLFVPNNPEDFTPEKFSENGIQYVPPVDLGDGRYGWIMGGYYNNGNLSAQFNETTDVRAIQDYYRNGGSTSAGSGSNLWDFDIEMREVKPINGMTDTEFGYNAIRNTQNYQKNTNITPINYGLIPYFNNGYNCNSFSNSLINYSGGDTKSYDNDFKGVDSGRNQLIPNKNFNTNQTNWINNQFYIDINNGKLPGVFNIGK